MNANPGFGTTPNVGLLAFSFPAAAVGPDGTFFVAWFDFPNGSCLDTGSGPPACTNSDVRLSVSRDGGRTWTAPVKVSDETNATDQFFPWIATHPDGRLSLVWPDRRLDPNNVNYDAFYTGTLDGSSFLDDLRVTTATSVLGNQQFIGDYTGLAGTADAWCDMRSGNPDVLGAPGILLP